jgi:hypothetical protein
MPLTALAIKQAKPDKTRALKLYDGGGLYLLLLPRPTPASPRRAYWRLKYRFAGKEKLLALGVAGDGNDGSSDSVRGLAKPSQEGRTSRVRVAAGTFTRPIAIGPRAVAWPSDAIDAWIGERIREGHIAHGQRPLGKQGRADVWPEAWGILGRASTLAMYAHEWGRC